MSDHFNIGLWDLAQHQCERSINRFCFGHDHTSRFRGGFILS
jgi:hypothetical protein